MLTLIGDVHGQYDKYIVTAKQHKSTLQVGDMGFEYSRLSELDNNKHKFIFGNHDNPGNYFGSPNFLGRYGVSTLGGINFFYVGGANSIDKPWRTAGIDWWPSEELSYNERDNCISWYRETKPKVMITHDCPLMLYPQFGIFDANNHTSKLLQRLYEMHRPDFWIFGHHHKYKEMSIFNTKFVCVGILDTFLLQE